MLGIPVLNYRLPNRQLGSFGTSPLGQAADWLTLTWLRLETFLVWLVLVPLLPVMERPSSMSLLETSLASPVVALFSVFALRLMGWVIYFIPGPNRIWGWGRIAFLWVFSRLVVEEAPELEIPAWMQKK